MLQLKNIIIIFILGTFSHHALGQPYLDLLNTRFLASPNAGISNPDKNPLQLKNFNATFNIPFRFKKSGDAILFNPYIENWNIAWTDHDYANHNLWGLGLPLGYLKQIPHSHWSLLTMAIVRMNAENPGEAKNKFQWGGLVLANFKKREGLVFRFGAYYNQECFGPFFIPLLGIDWKINERSNLFGTLPNQLVYENRISPKLYYGAAIRFITNSYRLNAPDFATGKYYHYLRIDENQLGAYLDAYLTKNLVLNIEFGHSILRKLKTGYYSSRNAYSFNLNPRDNLYIKASLAYRIRLR